MSETLGQAYDKIMGDLLAPKPVKETKTDNPKKKKRKTNQKLAICLETIARLTAYKKTSGKTPLQIGNLIKKEANKQLRKETGGYLSPEEADLIDQIATALCQRDESIFSEFCHRVRNRTLPAAGHANHIRETHRKITKEVKRLERLIVSATSSLSQESEMILEDLKKMAQDVDIVTNETKKTEKRLEYYQKPRKKTRQKKQ